MTIIRPLIIAPDSAHWSRWIDSALNLADKNHKSAVTLYDRLIAAGRVPLLTFHHLEELLAIYDGACAMRRTAFIRALPLIAVIRYPDTGMQTGTIVDIVGAELAACLDGAATMAEVRSNARDLLVRTGNGKDLIGTELWVWETVREECLRRKHNARSIAAIRRMDLFDDKRTFGEIAQGAIRPPLEGKARFARMGEEVTNHIRARGDRRIEHHAKVADWFMSEAGEITMPPDIDIRGLLQWALTGRGLDLEEIRDEVVLADLNRRAIFRTRLKIVADHIDVPFARLKTVDPAILPSLAIQHGLERHGQDRTRRPGSDLADECLAALAPYVDELFVDKRTLEDFTRLGRADKDLADRIGKVRRASESAGLL